ncbi:FAD-dependent monooxygenase [Streptomyces sp. DSM 41527]|uniref:FAD-dependent monooxygenase n=1 Tax=Streptomyces mooreae TaxID=3075523 RepID=A0ABU2TEB6_9ACTN|nr:FAD-dependent monooxygenase [Streptomyces sp. DSM 41527]MDT0459283.1 FAD-dependent monooxygenase [Streptomyces sp. DSM 41527]
MSPAGGTGANTALHDAAVLAGKLAAVRHSAGPVSAVAAYERDAPVRLRRRSGVTARRRAVHPGDPPCRKETP